VVVGGHACVSARVCARCPIAVLCGGVHVCMCACLGRGWGVGSQHQRRHCGRFLPRCVAGPLGRAGGGLILAHVCGRRTLQVRFVRPKHGPQIHQPSDGVQRPRRRYCQVLLRGLQRVLVRIRQVGLLVSHAAVQRLRCCLYPGCCTSRAVSRCSVWLAVGWVGGQRLLPLTGAPRCRAPATALGDPCEQAKPGRANRTA